MSTELQAENDSLFADPEDLDMQSQSILDAAGHEMSEFADEGDDYPAPTPLESDGKGPAFVDEFADVGEEGGPPPARPRRQPAAPAAAPADAPAQFADDEVPTGESLDEDTGEDPFGTGLLSRAREYGLDENSVRNRFSSAEALEQSLLLMDEQAIARSQQWQQNQQMAAEQWRLQQQAQRPQFAQPPTPQATPPVQQSPQGYVPPQQQYPQQQQPVDPQQLPAELRPYEINAEDYDERLATDLNGIQQNMLAVYQAQQAEMANMRSQLQQHEQAMQQRVAFEQQQQQLREYEQFDTILDSLGDDWTDLVGKGAQVHTNPNSAEAINRRNLYQQTELIKQVQLAQGRQLSMNSAVQSALQMVFPKRQQAAEQWHNQPRDAGGRFTARPTRRKNDAQVSPRERMLRKWDQHSARQG
jgi:hypothetical protein